MSFETKGSRLFAKMENHNPGGSIKDRIGLSMVRSFEKTGDLKPGGTLVEATAGNTGLGLALVAATRGYRLILVIPDKMSKEKVQHLKAMGAEIVMTRSDVEKGHPDYYQEKAERLAASIPGAVYVNQFANPANPAAHEETTGPEIWEQMEHDVDAVVCGVGSGGTLTGLSRFFKRVSPKTRIVLADPRGSILAEYIRSGKIGQAGSWLVEGIGEDFLPPIADLSNVSHAYTIGDREAFETARSLLRHEGILGGSSCGVLLAAALRYIQEQDKPQRVVTFVCDSGNKYLSKMFNDQWMDEHGFLDRLKHGDLRDLISRSHQRGETITVGPDDTLKTACNRMKQADVSQLPVLSGDRLVGVLDESDILLAALDDPDTLADTVSSAMTKNPETVLPSATLRDLVRLFNHNRAALIVGSDGTFHGLITRIDLITHLRNRLDT
ncbi:pyridoxal-phosphate dependent enzyme [Haematospirillum jordaniae]|nr:pyridoxal-phosphate dependent enzyme [Haematospirillum jordaniae]NKD56342.1 pyridoxal-phosphate dependent enzyme [Haematospirillum jordaniae]NKD58400.1 pyridoxal-phosphate dependent enzyme [Haematospirillum jordaniae]NKD66431.1 pyridoxal-phosphate dependent enzyme [Haematospirillum jordaniae]NKD78402.1 pyridoxal-phosphate dependent enzyme [Haematospirillum jordaniae]